VFALVALLSCALACGDPTKLIFDADAGADASVAGTGGSFGFAGTAGNSGSAGASGSGGASGGAAGTGGVAGGAGGPLLDASVPLDAGADAGLDAARSSAQ
jgi:penicillin-binding protein 1A